MFKNLVRAFAVLVALTAGYTLASVDTAEAKSKVVKSGTFEGRSDHIVTGGISIVKTSSGFVAVLESDFSLDGAPAPTLGFGSGGEYVKASEFSKLENKDGLQVYAIPANINPKDFKEFYVWCSKFDVPLGVAKLK